MIDYMKQHGEKQDDQAFISHVQKTGSGTGFEFQGGRGMSEVDQEDKKGGYKFMQDKNVKTHHLLVLLLRLRQICSHPGLIRSMLDAESRVNEGIEDEIGEEADLVSQLADMSLSSKAGKGPSEEVENILDISNPVFREHRESSKIEKVVTELKKLKAKHRETGIMEKAVIVSQWTSMLEIIKSHVDKVGMKCTAINGKVPVKDRGDIVTAFNKADRGPQVMLLSLAAGGVGLNLVGANHLFMLDMHWNPQLESQACDRVYRVGQTKEVTVHKFVCEDTVEIRIKHLQEKKLELADSVLTGAKRVGANKLTFDDLKMLFNVH